MEDKNINRIITELRYKGLKPKIIAEQLGVSDAMISIWRNKDNDFVPRLPIARKIYKIYGFVTWPYSLKAVSNDT